MGNNQAKPDSFYTKLFARFYDPFVSGFEKKVLVYKRKEILSDLTGDILEVGSGTGINFPLYHENANVIASEPSNEMLNYAKTKLNEANVIANIQLIQAGVGNKELESIISPNGLDAIVCTLVLCTIPHPEEAIELFKKWLKPTGKLIILEHIHGNKQPRRMTHQLLNPVWKKFAEGCHLTRDTDVLLKEMGFKATYEYYFTKGLPFYQAVLVLES